MHPHYSDPIRPLSRGQQKTRCLLSRIPDDPPVLPRHQVHLGRLVPGPPKPSVDTEMLLDLIREREQLFSEPAIRMTIFSRAASEPVREEYLDAK